MIQPLLHCQLADLRPKALLESGIRQDLAVKGREILDRSVEKHGGFAQWKAHKTASVTFTDNWPGFLTRSMGMPWPQNGQRMRLDLLLGTDNSRLQFLEGPWTNEVWGIQHWTTYKILPNETPHFVESDEIKFWLPTLEYFIESPFRIIEADIIAYAGETTLNEIAYDLIFATWKSAEPQETIDHYMAWVNRETGLVDFLQYTVRDVAPFMTGAMRYSDYRNVQGIMVPFELSAISAPDGDDITHQMKVEEIRFATGMSADEFFPDQGRQSGKY